MKAKISLVAIVMAGFILFASCGSTSSSSKSTTSSASTSTAQTQGYNTGSAVGTSLLGLYQQYKTTKTLDFKNANTYLQLMTLATQVSTIKQNYQNPTFYAGFTKGAVVGSQQTVNQSNVSGVINALVGLDLSGILSGNSSNVSSSVLNGLTNIFNLFGK